MAAELARVATGRALIVAETLTHEEEQRNLLGRYIQTQMQEGTDYGVIPGTKNRTLLKPGAEKLTQLFRCVPRFTVEEKIEDWKTGLFYYRFRCEIITQGDGATVAEGVGSCSTYESRYRWRNADRVCPACGKPAIIKGKADYGGGWLCFKKKDGCGAKFGDNDTAITDQKTGRVENPDLHDCVNTVLKMAKKRSLVDAAISLARCSDIFTQDAEDMHFPEPGRGAEVVPDAEVVTRGPATNGGGRLPSSDDLFRDAVEAMRNAAEVSCDELKVVWGKIAPDRKLFTADQWAQIETLKDVLKAKCQQQAKPAADGSDIEEREDYLERVRHCCDRLGVTPDVFVMRSRAAVGVPASAAAPQVGRLTTAQLATLAGLAEAALDIESGR